MEVSWNRGTQWDCWFLWTGKSQSKMDDDLGIPLWLRKPPHSKISILLIITYYFWESSHYYQLLRSVTFQQFFLARRHTKFIPPTGGPLDPWRNPWRRWTSRGGPAEVASLRLDSESFHESSRLILSKLFFYNVQIVWKGVHWIINGTNNKQTTIFLLWKIL